MKASRDALLDGLKWVAQAVPQRPSVPILTGVRMAASGGVLVLAATDFNTTARAAVAVDGDMPPVVVPHAVLVDALKHSRATDLDMSLIDDTLAVKAGRSSWSIHTMIADTYPTLPVAPDGGADVDAAEFGEAVATAGLAALKDPDGAGIGLNGMLITAGPDGLTLVATDKYRVHRRTVKAAVDEGRVITEAAGLHKALKLIGAGRVKLALGGKVIGLTAPDRSVSLTVLDVQYPDMGRVLGQAQANNTGSITLDRDPLVAAISAASVTRERDEPVRIDITADTFTVSSRGGATGDRAESDVDVDASGEWTLLINPRFLLDGIQSIPGDTLTIQIAEPRFVRKPLTITGDEGAMALVMPIVAGLDEIKADFEKGQN